MNPIRTHQPPRRPLDADARRRRIGEALRRARLARGLSQDRLVFHIRQTALGLGTQSLLPTDESLKAMISRWENGHRSPDQTNRKLLCLALRISEEHLLRAAAGDEPTKPG